MRYPAHVAVGDSPEVLRRILEPGINLAIWERALSLELKASVAAVAARVPKIIPWFSKPIVPYPVASAWGGFLRELPYELRYEDAAPLMADMRDCTNLFTRIVHPEHLTISWRAERRARSWGRDWHHDAIRFRKLCIYHGATTLGLANGDAIRILDSQIGYRKRWLARPWCLPLGAVAVFKGLDHEHGEDHPWVHTEPDSPGLRLLHVVTG